MKRSRQFWAIVCFGILSAAPVVPIGISLSKLRNAVIFDEAVTWSEGSEVKYSLPAFETGVHELRFDSAVSDWQPTIQVSWSLREKQTDREIAGSLSPQEIVMTNPLATIDIREKTGGETELSMKFINGNPTDRLVRLKVGRDRDALLAKSSREFGIVLAISLVLSLLLWKPLMTPPKVIG